MKINIFIYSSAYSALSLLSGCSITPHTYRNTYTPETLPEISSKPGAHTIAGSAFLRQKGGGLVTCAGSPVTVSKQIPITRNAYALEYLGLPYNTQISSPVDPRLLDFEAQLVNIKKSSMQKSFCDIDGKFQIENLTPGTYKVRTIVFWKVGKEGQGGIVSNLITIPDSDTPKTIRAIVDTVEISCSIFHNMCEQKNLDHLKP